MMQRTRFRFPAVLSTVALLLICAAVRAQDRGTGTAGATPQTASQAAVAMVTSVTGAATSSVAGKEAALSVGDELPAAAVVAVKNGDVSLVFMAGDFVSLASGESITLGSTAAASTLVTGGTSRGVSQQDAVTVADNGVAAQNTSQRWQSQLTRMYGIRGDAAVVAVSPRLITSSASPAFVFFDPDSSKADRERTYTVRVRDDAGKTVLERQVTARPMQFVEVSSGEAALAGAAPEKRFAWSVTPADATGAAGEAAFLFADKEGMRLADAERTRMASLVSGKKIDAVSQHTLLALYYLDERQRLFADAVPHLLALAKTESGRTFAGRQLGLTLARFGNQTAAIAVRAAERAGR